jgi:phospholipase/carboxylesterase
MQLHPGLVRRAILLRGTRVLEETGSADLSETRVQVLEGRDDPLVRGASTLVDDLWARGASLDVRTVSAGHDLTSADAAEAARWLRQNLSGDAAVRRTGTST